MKTELLLHWPVINWNLVVVTVKIILSEKKKKKRKERGNRDLMGEFWKILVKRRNEEQRKGERDVGLQKIWEKRRRVNA